MGKVEDFNKVVEKSYSFQDASITLGGAMLDGEVQTGSLIKVALKNLNRHGLIAGATGTGKTKSLQVFAESLSDHGVPVVLMDVKGDLSGIARPSDGHKKIDERQDSIGLPFNPAAFPVEILTISKDKGTPMRATISEFGPVLLAKILELNETQSSIVSLLFKFADDKDLALLDLKDFKKLCQYAIGDGKAIIKEEYGAISTASVGTISRKVIELEQQGAELFFGEKSFETEDLIRLDEEGKGYISILRLTDIQDKPKLFSTFMLCLLSEIYATFPEQGDADKPKLVLCIDEAHLVFKRASRTLLAQIESIVKLIRSKGVGIYFITQNPTDVPDGVLSQLGLKIQHSLRAFTAKDRKKIRLAAQNFPPSDFYELDEELTTLGIGEALVTGLNEDGIPTEVIRTMMVAPRSRMGILTAKELKEVIAQSDILEEYEEVIDRESAYEILTAKIKAAKAGEREVKEKPRSRRRRAPKETSIFDNTMVKQMGNTVARELTRGILGALGIKTTRRRKRRTSFW